MVKKQVPQSSTRPMEVISKKRKKEESVPQISKPSLSTSSQHLTIYFLTYPSIQAQTGDHPSAMKVSLEAVGVTVGRKTQRDRLLELLSRHVIKKKPRMSQRVPDIKPKRSDKYTALKEMPESKFPSQPSSDGPNYSRFVDSDLVEMIRGVGVDPAGFDRTNLIKTCNTYSDLSELLVFSQRFD